MVFNNVYVDWGSCWSSSTVDTFVRQNKELNYLRSNGLIMGEMNWSCDQSFGEGTFRK